MTTICVNQFPNVFGNWHILGYLSAIFHFINNMNNTFLERRSSISCCGDDLSPRSPRWRPERWRRTVWLRKRVNERERMQCRAEEQISIDQVG